MGHPGLNLAFLLWRRGMTRFQIYAEMLYVNLFVILPPNKVSFKNEFR